MLQLPVASTSKAIPPSSPPVENTTFDRIRRHKALSEQLLSLWETEEQAVAAAERTLGKQPSALIAWRNYSAIGGDEIEGARLEFLNLGIPSDVVEQEYLDAKRRHEKQIAERRFWAKKAGIHEINQKWEAVLEERKSVMRSFIDEPPVSTKAASALILYILEFYDGDEFDERACDCLRGIAGALSMGDDRRIS